MRRSKVKRMVHDIVPHARPVRDGFCPIDGKKIYPSIKAGWNAINYIRVNSNDRLPGFEMRPYVGVSCCKVHVGHTRIKVGR
jgi:hypothetical protein